MDRHDGVDASEAEVAALHSLDVEVQERHGVEYLGYWFDPVEHSVFCFVDAPDKERAEAVHAEAHGQVANRIIAVEGRSVADFLGPLPAEPDSDANGGSAFRSILFTDIVDSTKLTQRLGDHGAMELLHTHDRIVRAALGATGGSEVKHTGDGIMASFESVPSSVDCAVHVQQQLTEHGRDAEHPIVVRIGISAGEPVTEHNDLFGAAVQLAARACARAEPGSIFVSVEARELCDATHLQFEPRGPFELKGFDEPVSLFEVAWRASA